MVYSAPQVYTSHTNTTAAAHHTSNWPCILLLSEQQALTVHASQQSSASSCNHVAMRGYTLIHSVIASKWHLDFIWFLNTDWSLEHQFSVRWQTETWGFTLSSQTCTLRHGIHTLAISGFQNIMRSAWTLPLVSYFHTFLITRPWAER